MDSKVRLSPRQAAIFQYLVDGKTSKEIAVLLGIKTRTIRRHMQNVKKKIGAVSLYQCVAILVSKNVVKPSSVPALDTPLNQRPNGGIGD